MASSQTIRGDFCGGALRAIVEQLIANELAIIAYRCRFEFQCTRDAPHTWECIHRTTGGMRDSYTHVREALYRYRREIHYPKIQEDLKTYCMMLCVYTETCDHHLQPCELSDIHTDSLVRTAPPWKYTIDDRFADVTRAIHILNRGVTSIHTVPGWGYSWATYTRMLDHDKLVQTTRPVPLSLDHGIVVYRYLEYIMGEFRVAAQAPDGTIRRWLPDELIYMIIEVALNVTGVATFMREYPALLPRVATPAVLPLT